MSSNVVPTTIKLATNLIGSATIIAGYQISRMQSALTKDGVADCSAFRIGLGTWMKCNGIFTTTFFVNKFETLNNIRDAPFILSNHISYLDGPIILNELDAPKIVVKDELKDWPVIVKDPTDCSP